MRNSSGEPMLSINELNKILPSYLVNEVEQDNIDNNLNKKSIINNVFSNEKVSFNKFNFNLKL